MKIPSKKGSLSHSKPAISKVFFASFLFVFFALASILPSIANPEGIPTPILTQGSVADIASNIAPSVVSLEISVKGRKAIPSTMDRVDLRGTKIYRIIPKIEEIESKVGDGSGFIISNDGYIVTNFHVINPSINNQTVKPSKIEVILYDGEKHLAQVIGEDEDSDIALIKINKNNLKPIQWGDSGLVRPGEFAITIGSSLGADHTVGFGIISAVSRKKKVTKAALFGDLDYIQTYAQINPGNSGGPLINMKGEVIGITSFIQLAPHSPGFAIPSNYAKKIVTSLQQDGIVKRPAIGVYITTLKRAFLDIEADGGAPIEQNGVYVKEIKQGGPADKAGLKEGDIITKINQIEVKLPEEFTHEIRSNPVGSVFGVEVLRKGQVLKLQVKSVYLDE